jgi:hypothetical protein
VSDAKKKPGLMAVEIALGKKPDAKEEASEPAPDSGSSPDDTSEAYADAGNSVKEALKSGDGAAIADALCELFDLHNEASKA